MRTISLPGADLVGPGLEHTEKTQVVGIVPHPLVEALLQRRRAIYRQRREVPEGRQFLSYDHLEERIPSFSSVWLLARIADVHIPALFPAGPSLQRSSAPCTGRVTRCCRPSERGGYPGRSVRRGRWAVVRFQGRGQLACLGCLSDFLKVL